MKRFFNKKKTVDSSILKILLLGDSGVGKTSLLYSLLNNTLPINSELFWMTGSQFHVKHMKVEGLDVNLQVWDIATDIKKLPKVAQDYDLAIVLFPLNRSAVEKETGRWDDFIEETAKDGVIKFHVGTKKDLQAEYCQPTVAYNSDVLHRRQVPMVKYLEVSAKSGENVQALFLAAASEVIAARKKLASGSKCVFALSS